MTRAPSVFSGCCSDGQLACSGCVWLVDPTAKQIADRKVLSRVWKRLHRCMGTCMGWNRRFKPSWFSRSALRRPSVRPWSTPEGRGFLLSLSREETPFVNSSSFWQTSATTRGWFDGVWPTRAFVAPNRCHRSTMNATRATSGCVACNHASVSRKARVEWKKEPTLRKRRANVEAKANENQVNATSTAMESQGTVERSVDAKELDAKYVLQTYARAPPVFVKGKGCVLVDQEGKEYLDFASGIAVNALGHADEEWLRTVQEQAATLTHVSNLYHTVPQAELARVLVESSFGDRVFYCNSGTEANEAAIKFARKCARKKAGVDDQAEFNHPPKRSWWNWGNSNQTYTDANGQPAPPTEIVAFSDGFHGRTMGALALTWKKQYRTPFQPVMPGAAFATYNDLDSARKVIQKGKTAAVFVEPVQGEGGCNPADPKFLQGLRELCDETGALLVFDEVQCGLGRTGSLWAYEPFGVTPDIMTLAKPLAGGLPIGAVLMTEQVAQAMAPGDHGTTFASGPLICSAALTVMKRVQAPGFLDDVQKKGELLRALLREALGDHPAVESVRGSGLLVGVQMNKMVGPLVNAAREQGLLVISAGKGDVLRIVPPLVVTEEQIKQCVSVLKDCMNVL